ncbi:NAD(P)/FAD-dependent oxidoreductase [Streptomyces sp. 4N509B]|uniref:NAD(P)/FAD-dependent oxidoreductase n=1 Tax=Streptomyces sp. 4N509B TaxID=3457413 RepID=UPI003FCF5F52
MSSPLTARHAIVLADADPVRREALRSGIERWYGEQFAVVTAADAGDSLRIASALGAEGVLPVLVAAVAESEERIVAEALDASRLPQGAGRLWLTPSPAVNGAASGPGERGGDGVGRLPFPVDRPQDLDVRLIDTLLADWWRGATPQERGALTLVVVGAHYRTQRAFEIRAFLSGCGVVFGWTEQPASEPVQVVVFDVEGGQVETLVEPTLAQLAVACRLVDKPVGTVFDVIVVGGGPAGLATGIYAGTEGLRALIVENGAPGGQVATSHEVANYLGFPDGISGWELSRRALAQARKYGVGWLPGHVAGPLTLGTGTQRHRVTVGADVYEAGAVVIASGLKPVELDATGAKAVLGRGLYYSTLEVDLELLKGQPVVVVGGGNSAGEAALQLAGFASRVTMLVRSTLKMSGYLEDAVRRTPNIDVWEGYVVDECFADGHGELHRVRVRGTATFDLHYLDTRWLYCLLGGTPDTAWLGRTAAERIRSDGKGFVLTGHHLPKEVQPAAPTRTSVAGVHAVGDVRKGYPPRVGSAVGQGSAAVVDVLEYRAANPGLFPSLTTATEAAAEPAVG